MQRTYQYNYLRLTYKITNGNERDARGKATILCDNTCIRKEGFKESLERISVLKLKRFQQFMCVLKASASSGTADKADEKVSHIVVLYAMPLKTYGYIRIPNTRS